MAINLFGWITLALVGTATAVSGYFVYPWLERSLLQSFTHYLDWVATTRERMFAPVKRKWIGLLIILCTGTMATFGYFVSRGYGLITGIFVLLFAWAGWSLIRAWITWRWQQRIAKFDQQLVDGLNLMANSLKSGLNLSQAIQVMVKEMPDPLAQEFALVLSHEKLGLKLDEALEKMLERVSSEDLGVAIHSILILRETGGDLSETFETIANTIRERRKVTGKIKSMTAQGRMQALILFLLPFGLLFLLYFSNPGYVLPLFRTQLGWIFITVMLFFQVIGGVWLRKVVKIDV